jgi:hypothetical protein
MKEDLAAIVEALDDLLPPMIASIIVLSMLFHACASLH